MLLVERRNRESRCCGRIGLARTVANAGVQDGMQILDLGCGWGSLTVWLFERFPNVERLPLSLIRILNGSILIFD